MGWEKKEPKIDHPKFFLPSAELGQLRKSIDRISTRTMKKNVFLRGYLELSMFLWSTLPLPAHVPIQSSFLELFERKL